MLRLHTPKPIPEWIPCPFCVDGPPTLEILLTSGKCAQCWDGRILGEVAVEMISLYRHAIENWDLTSVGAGPDDLRACIQQLESLLDQA